MRSHPFFVRALRIPVALVPVREYDSPGEEIFPGDVAKALIPLAGSSAQAPLGGTILRCRAIVWVVSARSCPSLPALVFEAFCAPSPRRGEGRPFRRTS